MSITKIYGMSSGERGRGETRTRVPRTLTARPAFPPSDRDAVGGPTPFDPGGGADRREETVGFCSLRRARRGREERRFGKLEPGARLLEGHPHAGGRLTRSFE